MDWSEKQLVIMDAAEQLFADKGFDGTSVRDISEAAGVNLAMISYYFGSKEKLMEAMFTHRGQTMTLQLQNIIDNRQLTPIQKVEKLIDEYIDRIFKKQGFHRIMVREQMGHANKPISGQILKLKQTNQELVRELIQQGQKSGDFKKNIDISFLMMTLVGTTSQLVTTQGFYRQLNGLEDMPDEVFQKTMRKKLGHYMKTLFKAMLTYEE